MIVLARRGDVRAALASVLPHAGRESEDTPDLGRVRFAPTVDHLLVWATDYGTAALAAVRVAHVDGELDTWDLSVQSCRQILAVFQGPSGKDARAMWEDGDLRLEVTAGQLVATEVHAIPAAGRSLLVPRVAVEGEDRYPDVPRTAHALLGEVHARAIAYRAARAAGVEVRRPPEGATTRSGLPIVPLADAGADGAVSVEALTKLAASGKAWGEAVTVTRVGSPYLARVGDQFVAVVPDRARLDEDERDERDRDLSAAWRDRLAPVRRPVPAPPPPPEVAETLARQAAEHLAATGGRARLRVVRDEDDPRRLDVDEPLPIFADDDDEVDR